ncbi:MAG TPA: transglutaminase domain-containing protein, partial [Proteobacteria bacterium]|nr:transglutaminase domain-containing protein [Pseudomonadota bacterium]
FIVCFWLVTTGMLIGQQVEKTQGARSLPITAEELGNSDEIWLGIYFRQGSSEGDESLVKIGYTKLTREKIKDGYRYEERTRMRMTLQGQRRVVQTHTRATVDSSGRLKFFDFEMKSGPIQLLIWGHIKGKQLEVKVETGGAVQSMTIPFQEEPRIPLNLMEDVDFKALKPGQTITREFFDPTTMTTAKASITFLGVEPYRIGDGTINAYKFRQKVMGIEVTSWLDENKNMLREETANMVTRRESPKYAVSEGWKDKSIDLIMFNAVPTSVNIPEPRKVRRLKIRVSGVELADFDIPDWRQKIVEPNVVEVNRAELKGIKTYRLGDPKIAEEFAEYLKPTPTIQCDHPAIKERAKRIVGEKRDALGAARAIHEWVYKNLDKEITVSIPSALEVLELMRGDCNEHATLTVALLRAVGIPSKLLAGLIYLDGAFYYHAWVGVYVGEWIAIDPTLGVFPADAARLKLTEGDLSQMVKILQALGKIKLEVVEYE